MHWNRLRFDGLDEVAVDMVGVIIRSARGRLAAILSVADHVLGLIASETGTVGEITRLLKMLTCLKKSTYSDLLGWPLVGLAKDLLLLDLTMIGE